ncbi:hypothetical protein NA57DRAFT_70407 [Rhizodiscina lignyota]|uniref:Uncharacterized protein n=1 Tax=Rhizodiscina lignyota TaxID=1504668 RepID=A0A9P4IRS2_9PEZI|nr:hypothetical protein NA57DRAFT_70407 [Rhizodiscina lignyota]
MLGILRAPSAIQQDKRSYFPGITFRRARLPLMLKQQNSEPFIDSERPSHISHKLSHPSTPAEHEEGAEEMDVGRVHSLSTLTVAAEQGACATIPSPNPTRQDEIHESPLRYENIEMYPEPWVPRVPLMNGRRNVELLQEREQPESLGRRTSSSDFLESHHSASATSYGEESPPNLDTSLLLGGGGQYPPPAAQKMRPIQDKQTQAVANTDLSASSLRLPRRIPQLVQRLRVQKSKINAVRSDVRDLRKQSAKKRKRVRISQGRLLEAQTTGAGVKPVVMADEKLLHLAERMKVAERESKASEESLERAEKRLENLEHKWEEGHEELDKLLRLVISEAIFDDASDANEDEATDSDFASDSPSDDLPPLVRKYYDAVGRINITRERLNEFEIGHQTRLANREHAFEEMLIDGKVPTEYIATNHLDEGLLNAWFVAYRDFLDDYFMMRTSMACDLLCTHKTAVEAKHQYLLQTMQTPEDPDEPDALDEAIKYNLDGPIGRMYALHHEGKHHGIRPIELVQVPFLHWQDHVEHWRMEVLRETRDVPVQDGVDPATYKQDEQNSDHYRRGFQPYYDLVVRDERKLTQFSGSATDFKPSHIILPMEDDVSGVSPPLPPVHNVYTSRVHWTCWSGEFERPGRPQSMPDMSRTRKGDPFSIWSKTKQSTWDWQRDMLTV